MEVHRTNLIKNEDKHRPHCEFIGEGVPIHKARHRVAHKIFEGNKYLEWETCDPRDPLQHGDSSDQSWDHCWSDPTLQILQVHHLPQLFAIRKGGLLHKLVRYIPLAYLLEQLLVRPPTYREEQPVRLRERGVHWAVCDSGGQDVQGLAIPDIERGSRVDQHHPLHHQLFPLQKLNPHHQHHPRRIHALWRQLLRTRSLIHWSHIPRIQHRYIHPCSLLHLFSPLSLGITHLQEQRSQQTVHVTTSNRQEGHHGVL